MFADTEKELEEMARKLGLKREWRQGENYNWVGELIHYDIAKSKRVKAIQLGAIPLDDVEAEADVLNRVIDGGI
jgi:hypothetical protein